MSELRNSSSALPHLLQSLVGNSAESEIALVLMMRCQRGTVSRVHDYLASNRPAGTRSAHLVYPGHLRDERRGFVRGPRLAVVAAREGQELGLRRKLCIISAAGRARRRSLPALALQGVCGRRLDVGFEWRVLEGVGASAGCKCRRLCRCCMPWDICIMKLSVFSGVNTTRMFSQVSTPHACCRAPTQFRSRQTSPLQVTETVVFDF